MSHQRFSPEFKDEAVRQITQRGYPVKEVAERLGVSTHSLYKWVKEAKPAKAEADELAATKLEMQKLKAELRRAVVLLEGGAMFLATRAVATTAELQPAGAARVRVGAVRMLMALLAFALVAGWPAQAWRLAHGVWMTG
ncbi:hypothetical protein DRQ50_13260 [bacterium]|nr:MAG: hypothetical protein DRQ50_13260 [bacterium]